MARRTFGSITRLPSGHYRARWRQDGERVTAAMTFATEQDARNYLLAVEADLLRGRRTQTNSTSMTLGAWLEEWLDDPGKDDASKDRDRQGVRAFTALLEIPLVGLTRQMVQSAEKRRAKEAATGTVKRDFSALRACLNAAVDVEILEAAPIPRRRSIPQEDGREPVVLSDEDVERLAASVPSWARALVLVAATLGCRWGEAAGLRICDIDFLAREAAVGEQVVKEHGGHVRLVRREGRKIRTGKTKAATRRRPVPDFLLGELSAHIARFRPDASPDDLVFVGLRGGVLRRSFEGRHFKKAAVLAGVARREVGGKLTSDLVFHDLRHHAITEMVEAGMPPNEIREWFGHKGVEMTERYMHATRTSAKLAAERMQEWYAAKAAHGSPQQETG